jgi:transposase
MNPPAKPMRLTNKQFEEFKQELDTIIDMYKKEFSEQKPTDWKTYEVQWAQRLRTALKEVKSVIDQADSCIRIKPKHFGRPPKAKAKQKVLILSAKDLAQFSNRKMANLLPLFSLFDDVDISYKTVERAYSDPIVRLIIHNMFIILVKRKGITHADLTGDGTGYSLTITKHYRSVREKAGEATKSNEPNLAADAVAEPQTKQDKKKLFTYAFALMDLESHLYVGYGASLRSERAAFEAALDVMHECGVEAKSVRLDQYYAGQSTAAVFGGDTSLYVIPKSNATIRGSYAWKDMVRDLISYPFLFLSEYFRREHSESGFSADKRCDGWKIWQRRDDRIETATMFKGVWHNLLWLGANT